MRKGRSLAAGNLPVELQQVRGTQVEHCRPAQLERPAFQKFRWINDTGVGQTEAGRWEKVCHLRASLELSRLLLGRERISSCGNTLISRPVRLSSNRRCSDIPSAGQ